MADEIDALIEEVVVDAYGPAEQLWSFRQVFEDTARFPFAAQVTGAVVDVIEIDFDGDDRHGLTAVCRRDGEAHRVALLDVTPNHSLSSDTRTLIDAYRRWSNAAPLPVVGARLQTPNSFPPSDAPTPSRVLGFLIGVESADVLTGLLDARPELCDQAKDVAQQRRHRRSQQSGPNRAGIDPP